MAEPTRTQVLRWYTTARRGLPILIGKLPKGERIWGGPYTLGQLAAFGVTLVLGQVTMGLWGQWGGLGNILVLVGVAVAVMILWGRLPTEKLNVWAWVQGVQAATTLSSRGRYRGTAFSLPPVRTARGHAAVGLADIEGLPDPLPLVPAAPPTIAAQDASQDTPDPVATTRPSRTATQTQQAWALRKDS